MVQLESTFVSHDMSWLKLVTFCDHPEYVWLRSMGLDRIMTNSYKEGRGSNQSIMSKIGSNFLSTTD